MKILIIKPSSLGDIVQALPVACSLKKHWPEARMDWLVFDAFAPLLEGHKALDRALVFPKKQFFHPSHWAKSRSWMRALRDSRYDLVIDLQGLARSGFLTWMTGAPRRIGLKSAREGAGLAYTETVSDTATAAAERYLAVLRHLEVPALPLEFGLHVPKMEIPPLVPGTYWVLHPYSRWETKLWPWSRYEPVVRAFSEMPAVVVGQGPWFPLREGPVVDLRNRLDLRQLMVVLQGARVVLSTDSGPAHLAAALEVPTLALFGATDWKKTGPVGKKVKIQASAVFCAPCLKRHCPRWEAPMDCLKSISADDVIISLRKLLS
jgi:heptosyltransferase-1